MCIGLFTSRIIIDTLGVDDYGVYGVAGGFVVMLAFINNSMAGATSRFITYEMGIGELERVKKTFANTLTVHLSIAAVILVICEAVGVWFLNTKLNIPANRMTAANILFQLSIFTACIQITQVPYTALIISHEKMGVYAYMEIANVTLKLAIVYLLIMLPGDKLVIYGILTAAVSFIIAMAYRFYCLRKFSESRTGPGYEKSVIRPILSFSGWDMYGNLCVSSSNQGMTFLLNIFFGVAINGAASIVNMLNSILSNFSGNIVMAFRPQIIKNYAQKALNNYMELITNASQYATLMLSMMAIPLIIETPYIFGLWLGEVPDWVVIFSRITIFTTIVAQINTVVGIGIHATGKIKRISFLSGTLYLMILPVTWIILRLGGTPPTAFIVSLCIMTLLLLVNIGNLKHNVPEFRVGKYLVKLAVLPLAALPVFAGCFLIHQNMPYGFGRVSIVCLTSILLTALLTYFVILNREQRLKFRLYIISRLHLHP